MNFGKELTNYMQLLDCSTKDISNESGITYSLVNRYINGKRTPREDSKNLEKIIDAIYKISLQKEINLSKESISENLKQSITGNILSIDFDIFIDNFNTLQNELSITTVELSRALGYDASFISRIKNKERKPADIGSFIDKITSYINFVISQNEEKKSSLAYILNCSKEDLQNRESFQQLFTQWACLKHIETKPNNVLNFLVQLDTFDLNDYIRTDFSKIKVPTTPYVFKNSKTFFGIEGRKKAEAEFMKTTLISNSNESIFFYSDLPISNAGTDEAFKQKWVYAMTMLLKKGLHLNIVHNLNRPIDEMLLGLENWIPIYMTGSITPYYFKTPPSNFFTGSHCTSGSVALTSECLKYNEEKSKFYLTTKKDEVEFEKEKSKYLISKATPLMIIYRENDKEEFEKFMNKEENKNLKKVEKDIFKNIDFCINEEKWIMINKKTTPEIHFVIYHEKLINSIKTFLLS